MATTTTDRIRAAEETVAQARTTLEKAEAGLHAAERVADTVDEVRSRPMMKAGMLLLMLSVIGLVVFLIQRDTD